MNYEIDARITPPSVGVSFDKGRHHRAKIGFLLLATEQTIQDDVMRLRPDGVGVHFARVPIPDSITSENLAAQIDLLSDCAATLLPDGSLDVICYACTSGSLVMGEENVHQELLKGAPGARATSLIHNVMSGLRAVGAKRIAIATPYLDEINLREADYMDNAGFEVLSISGLNLEKDSDMVRVSPQFIKEFAQSIDRDDADALFISCGALRTLDVVGAIEDAVGKPVIASNQAMIWETLRLAGIEDQIAGYGRLLLNY
ncbi:MAG: maleate isomerase [Parasphingorhabdus sp.]|jgi:maleate isomerase